jgi:DNA polymerase-3 subunit delta
VYLFKGDAEFLMEEAWSRLLEKVVPVKARGLNGDRVPANELTAAQVLARLSILPMFGSKQLLMVQHIEAWPKEQMGSILSYISRPCPSACLVMTVSQKKGTKKLEDAVKSVGAVVKFSTVTEKEAPRWLQERARQYNKRLAPPAALFLVDQGGLVLYLLKRELEKVVTYIGDRDRIELEDVRQTVSAERSFSVFELSRFVSRRQVHQAVLSLRKLILAGQAPLPILGLLSRDVRILWQTKDALERGMTVPQIAQRLKLPPWVVENSAEDGARLSAEELNQMHRLLRDTDLTLKSTASSPEVVLEALILDLCRIKQKSS